MKISETQLRTIVKRIINEQATPKEKRLDQGEFPTLMFSDDQEEWVAAKERYEELVQMGFQFWPGMVIYDDCTASLHSAPYEATCIFTKNGFAAIKKGGGYTHERNELEDAGVTHIWETTDTVDRDYETPWSGRPTPL